MRRRGEGERRRMERNGELTRERRTERVPNMKSGEVGVWLVEEGNGKENGEGGRGKGEGRGIEKRGGGRWVGGHGWGNGKGGRGKGEVGRGKGKDR